MREDLKKLGILVFFLLIIFLGLLFFRPTGNFVFTIQSTPGNNTSLCQELNVSGTYILNTNILNENISSSGCFNITASNIELNCSGYSIRNATVSAPAIYAGGVRNITIRNCNISLSNSSGSYGIYFVDVNNSYILDSLISSNYFGICLKGGYNNVLRGNTLSSNSYKGIYTESALNTSLQNNNFTLNADTGIELNISSNSTISGNILISNKKGISVLKSSGSVFSNNNIWNCTQSDNTGCLSFLGSSLNTIASGGINLSTGDLVFLSDLAGDNSSNNLFKDLAISGATGFDVNLTKSSGANINNTFLNVGYNSSKEFVASGNELLRKWYYRALVNNSRGNLVSNANLTIKNSSGVVVCSALTASNGLISTQELFFYRNNGTQSYCNNYTVNASNITLSASHSFTLTDNLLTDFFTFNVSVASSNSTNSTNSTSPGATDTTTLSGTASANSTSNLTSGSNTGQGSTTSKSGPYYASSEQLEGGIRYELKKEEILYFNISQEDHTLKVENLIKNNSNLSMSYLTILVQSEPVNLTLGVGEQKKLDLNSDNYYEILVGFEGLSLDEEKAVVYLMKINETTQKGKDIIINSGQNIPLKSNNFVLELIKKMNRPLFFGITWIHVIIGIAAIGALVAIYFFVVKKMIKKDAEHKKHNKHGKGKHRKI